MSEKNSELERALEQRDNDISLLLSIKEKRSRPFFNCLESCAEKKELSAFKNSHRFANPGLNSLRLYPS